MSIRCWQMVPGWDRELGRGLRSEKQAWRLHPGHQTARLDPGNHVNIADGGTAIVRQQAQLKRSNSLNVYSIVHDSRAPALVKTLYEIVQSYKTLT